MHLACPGLHLAREWLVSKYTRISRLNGFAEWLDVLA
jgi:hypothetical protein